MSAKIQEGIRYYNMKRWDLALSELLQVKVLDPEENVELAYYLGLCHMKLKRYKEALLYLEQVVTSSKNVLRTCQCRMVLAYAYSMSGHAKLAEFELKQLIKAGYKSVQIYSSLAFILWKQKQKGEALECYEKAHALDEENPTALNGLGFVLVEMGYDMKKGLLLCQKAVKSRPRNPAYLDSLAWAYYKSGNIVEARRYLRQARELDPQHPEIKLHLGIVVGSSR